MTLRQKTFWALTAFSIILAGAAAPWLLAYHGHAIPPLPPEEEAAAHERRMERTEQWRRDRFGVFLLWAPCAVAKLNDGAWPITRGQLTWEEFDALPAQFKAEEFDADKIARQIKQMGAKYVIFSAKHHGGFSMWDTEATDYNVMNTPFGRDSLKLIADACRKEGLRFGIYFSGWDWRRKEFRGKPKTAPNLNSERGGVWDLEKNPLWPKFLDFYHRQLEELLTRYGRIDVLWMDNGYATDRLYELLDEHQPETLLINRSYKQDPRRVDFISPENYIPRADLGEPWESCLTVTGRWYYSGPYCAPPSVVIRKGVETCSKNGNALIAFPLNEKGSYDPVVAECMQKVGEWFETNGEAVYGCGSVGFRSKFVTWNWGLATARPGHVYLHVYPDRYNEVHQRRPIVLPDVLNEVRGAELLDGGQAIDVKRDGDDIVVTLPEDFKPAAEGTVVDLRIDGEVKLAPPRFIREWSLLAIPGDAKPDLPVQWRRFEADEDGRVNLMRLENRENIWQVILTVDINCPREMDTELLLGRTNIGKVFLNGKQIIRMAGHEMPAEPDAWGQPIHLNKGRNRLVVRMRKGSADEAKVGWGLYAWIAGGKAMDIRPGARREFLDRNPVTWTRADWFAEAEDAQLDASAATVATAEDENARPAASKGKYVSLKPTENDQAGGIEIECELAEPLESPKLLLRYMANQPTSVRVSVDGGESKDVAFGATRGWHPFWQLAVVPLDDLEAGKHTLRISAGKSAIDVDAILLSEGLDTGAGILR